MSGLVNIAAFQLLWFAIVGGIVLGHDWLGPALLVAWLPVHLRQSRVARSDLNLFLLLGVLGPVLDTALIQAELIRFEGVTSFPGFAPFWMMALWANFALTLNHSLKWINRNVVLAATLGAVGGPLAYYAGARMGAAQLADPVWQPLLALAVIWSMTMTALWRFLREDETSIAI